MRSRIIAILAVVTLLAMVGWAKKKNKDEATQVLELPKDPPMVAAGETRKLVFSVSPLTGKGLLSQQTKEALKSLLHSTGSAQLIHIRAFVAGSGDMRRVPQIVSEVLTDKKQQLPSVSVVQAGALGMLNSQVVLEAVSQTRKDVNPNGLRFVPGHTVTGPDPAAVVKPLLEDSLRQLAAAMQGSEALRVTCYVSNLDADALGIVTRQFPAAVPNVIQTQRAPSQALASCEGVGRGGPVTAERIEFSGTQVAFGFEEKDAALAFQRLEREISPDRIIFMHVYPLSRPVLDVVRKVRPSLPHGVAVPFEGVASMDASFAVDAVAVAK